MTPQETDPGLPVSVQESLVEVWPAAGSGRCVQQRLRGTL